MRYVISKMRLRFSFASDVAATCHAATSRHCHAAITLRCREMLSPLRAAFAAIADAAAADRCRLRYFATLILLRCFALRRFRRCFAAAATPRRHDCRRFRHAVMSPPLRHA